MEDYELVRLADEFYIAARHLLAQLRAAIVYRSLDREDYELGMLILNRHLWAPQFVFAEPPKRDLTIFKNCVIIAYHRWKEGKRWKD